MKNRLLASLFLCLFLLSGCWDKQELEDHTFVIMLGVDKAEDDDLLVTVAFPITQTNSGGAESQGEYSVMSAKAPTIAQAISIFNVSQAGPVSLFTTKTLVISEDLARDDLLSHLFASWRYEQMRNNTNVLISSGSAADFVSARVENTLIDPLRQEDLLLEGSSYSAHSRPIQLLDLTAVIQSNSRDAAAMYGGLIPEPEAAKKPGGGTQVQSNEPSSNSEESQDQPDESASGEEGQGQSDEGGGGDPSNTHATVRLGYLPGQAPLSGKSNTQISGLAIFRGNRMVGVLDSFEAQTFAMMTKSNTRKLITLPDPFSEGDDIVFAILPTRKSRIRAHFVEGVPTFDIRVNLRCNIEHIRGEANYDMDMLAEYIRQACAQNMERLVRKLQKELEVDILGLGDRLARNFLTVQEWEAWNWREQYPDAQIHIHLNLSMDRSGI